ncbi:MAG: arginine--tRNA ligase [Ruminococcaceae bacterium]|nr:arginine--tRNA ligase [Oscillospiraceae bacterium]
MKSIKDITLDIILKDPDISSAFTCEEATKLITTPPDPELGDVTFPCFKLAKTMRKAPNMIAAELAERIGSANSETFSNVEAAGGYLNFFISDKYLSGTLLSEIEAEGESFGKNEIGKGKTMVIDYSSPNIAKPFHIGHLGTTAIGNSIKRIHEFSGYDCVGINHLGDWGTQFGRLIVAYKNWGSKEAIEKGGVKELARIYADFYVRAEEDPSLNDMARDEFTKMERGDEEALALWEWFKKISLDEFMRMYDVLGIKFESYSGESFYNDKMDAVVKELEDKGILEDSEGAKIVRLDDYDMPPCLILKKDGSTLYATRDITAAIYRNNTYKFDKCLYVTDAGQSLHFAQWFKVIGLMGYDFEDKLVHIPYGKISVEGKKLATRTGNVVLLEDLFSEAIERVRAIIEEKNPDREDKDEIARKVGLGAVIFNQLSSGRIKNVNFVWDEVLNFDGSTGPYAMYTYARCCSVLEKASAEPVSAAPSTELTKEEKELLLTVTSFPEKVKKALAEYEPCDITRYVIDLSQSFNRFYHNCPILKCEDDKKALRIKLCRAVKAALGNALYLIGIEKTEKI